MIKNLLTAVLRKIGHAIPNIRYVRALPNLVLKPLHNRLKLGGGIVPVLDFRMLLDPRECVDAALWFTPHTYDNKELWFVTRNYHGGVFLDIGANIGFWSLYVAQTFPTAPIYAIEANPNTFSILEKNVAVNGFSNIHPFNFGVAGKNGSMPLYLNESGNRGGDTLKQTDGARREINIAVRTLHSFVEEMEIPEIELIKVDIEGMECEMFEAFFKNSERNIYPNYICAETLHSQTLADLLVQYGYTVVCIGRENSVFEKVWR